MLHNCCHISLQQGLCSCPIIIKVKSHIGINGNEMVDTLANEAAEASSTACDYDLSRMCSDLLRLQQVTYVHTTTGSILQEAYVRDLDDSLEEVVHDKHTLGLSNTYYQAWAAL